MKKNTRLNIIEEFRFVTVNLQMISNQKRIIRAPITEFFCGTLWRDLSSGGSTVAAPVSHPVVSSARAAEASRYEGGDGHEGDNSLDRSGYVSHLVLSVSFAKVSYL